MKHSVVRLVLCALLSAVPGLAADWWKLSDADFVAQYKTLATGTQAEQSRFAWMLFARVNQQVTVGGQTNSAWEWWKSDPDTFPAAGASSEQLLKAKKIRARPHLQESKILQSLRLQAANQEKTVRDFLAAAGTAPEEVTRNDIGFDYITRHGLNTLAGLGQFFTNPQASVNFPLAAIEIKASWSQTSPGAGAYSFAGYYLTALHIMVKIAPRPADPYSDNSPSWFWTTFEFKGNQGLAAAQKFITYPDTLTPADIKAVLTQAGLGTTAFVNYVSNGQQIQFSDAAHAAIILGNTQLEGFLGSPASSNPAQWKKWPTSCHTCHARAGVILTSTGPGKPPVASINFAWMGQGVTGNLTGTNLPPAPPAYQSYDFVWAVANAQ